MTKAQRDLVETHAEMPRRLAQLFWRRSLGCSRTVDVEDLAADGAIGLVNAALAFSVTRPTPFATFAYMHVRGAIIDGHRNRSRAAGWSRRHGRLATVMSFDHFAGDEGDVLPANFIDPAESAADVAERASIWRRIETRLTPRERQVLRMILAGERPAEIATRAHLSISRVSQILSRIAAKGRHVIKPQVRRCQAFSASL